MKILAIDTATDACSAALYLDGAVHEEYDVAARQHTKLILPMVQTLLAEAGIDLQDIDAFAFTEGPGSFTGLRIAASVIQGLAFAVTKPVIPVSTLRVIAQGAYREWDTPHVLVALDARMSEIYWGCYTCDYAGVMRPQIGDVLSTVDKVPLPAEGLWQGMGSAWEMYGETLSRRLQGHLIGQMHDIYPHARDVAYLAQADFGVKKLTHAKTALPVYLRDKVAEKSTKQKLLGDS